MNYMRRNAGCNGIQFTESCIIDEKEDDETASFVCGSGIKKMKR